MKAKRFTSTIYSFFVVAIFAANATAAPVQYQMSGTIIGEAIGLALGPSYYPVAVGTPFSLTFLYDSSAPLVYLDPAVYQATAVGAVSNLEGFLGDFHIFSTKGNATVSGNIRLSFDFPTQPSDDSEGLTANGLSLTSMGMILFPLTGGGYTNQELPGSLNNEGMIPYFAFIDESDSYHGFTATYTLSQVPIPSAAFLFGTGIITTFGIARKTRNPKI